MPRLSAEEAEKMRRETVTQLRLLNEGRQEPVTPATLAESMGLHIRTVRYRLGVLVEEGMVRHHPDLGAYTAQLDGDERLGWKLAPVPDSTTEVEG